MSELEISSPREERDLRYFFGRDARIHTNREGNFAVTKTLRDALCPGGQLIEAVLLPKTRLSQYHLATDFKDKGYFAYPCKEIKVNGLRLPTAPIVFVPPDRQMKKIHKIVESLPPETREDVLVSKKIQEARNLYETHAVVSHIPHFIKLSSFDTADDLAVLFHELGEVNTGRSDARRDASYILDELPKIKWIKLIRRLGDLVGPAMYETPGSRQIGDIIFERINTVLKSERSASLNAIKQIEKLNPTHRLFPTDTGFVRVRKFLQTALLTYRNWNDGFFNPFLSNEQKKQLNKQLEL